MKQTLAIACLLNSAVAIRFFNQNEMTDDEIKESLAPVMYSQGVFSEAPPKATFSKVLNAAEQGKELRQDEVSETFRPTNYSQSAVIQPNEVNMSKKQEEQLMNDRQASNIIHHTNPDEVQHEQVKPVEQSKASKKNSAQNHLPEYIDDETLNDRISSAEISRITDVQLGYSQLPTTPDVGKRDLATDQAQTGWYPGFRGFYPYEAKNDFAQRSGNTKPDYPDVGVRDLGSSQPESQWYPGFRGYYPYESKNDYAQKSGSQLPTTPDVGKRDLASDQAQTGWYPGFRGFYPYESKNDFAQKSGSQLPTTPDVGKRDLSSEQAATGWYPGFRGFYPYESKNDFSQLPDVGIRDHEAVHSAHAWYPGDRKHYEFENEFDHAQTSAPNSV